MIKLNFRSLLFLTLFFFSLIASAQGQLKKQLSDTLNYIANREQWVGNVTVSSVQIKKKQVNIKTNSALASLPFREDIVADIYSAIRACLPAHNQNAELRCEVGGYAIEELVPNYYRSDKHDLKRVFADPGPAHPLLRNLSQPNKITKGLQNRHLAIWQSHGYYYNQSKARWEWQRARLNQTVEDLYSQGYVLPFLAPMLENAGANVLIPLERDWQTEEILIDNDDIEAASQYIETNGKHSWLPGRDLGFANTKEIYLQNENPFKMGTYRQVKTTNKADKLSTVSWYPYIRKAGRYAVYVSYKTLNNSSPKAHYTLYHKGGQTEFEVNQTMLGGTWLYLGHFEFEKGKSERSKLVLSNFCNEKDKIVTADAVKFGGGMGNIARQPHKTELYLASDIKTIEKLKPADLKRLSKDTIVPDTLYTAEPSTYPRFTEGARYWLQWAGAPDSIYSRSQGLNDYTDDFQSRGFWVNYIAGGSQQLPKGRGLNVPIDLALAFHSDAGVTVNDSIIGTLAICSTKNTDGKRSYATNVARLAARDLSDIVQTQIVKDIRLLFEPQWTRRGLWDKSYSESREPEVPTMLLELLSHQNFADMRYGLDPRFRFAVSRAVYKGILKYLHSVYGTQYKVQPLPVEQFSLQFTADNELSLNWEPVEDVLEPSAKPTKYILYTRIDDAGFDNGVLITKNSTKIQIESDKIYSFKIAAANKGGISFPSEILSACHVKNSRGIVMIVNGFDRISAPESFVVDSTSAGFLNKDDAGVPYLYDISFTGEQHDFSRNSAWNSDDAPGHGASYGNYETMLIAGNSFDYPAMHGKAIKEAGYSFVSASRKAVELKKIELTDYKIVDLILGKQKETFIGKREKPAEFKIFPLALQESIEAFCKAGGSLLFSGAHFASEMSKNEATKEDKEFFKKVLRCKFRTSKAALMGRIRTVNSPFQTFEKSKFTFYNMPNSSSYYVESPDAIESIDSKGYTICRYDENNLSAGIAYDTGVNRICAFAFPLETIKEEKERNKLMRGVLAFLNKEKR